MSKGRIVEMAVQMSPTGLMRDVALAKLPAGGLDLQAARSLVAGGTIELRVTPTPSKDDPKFPRATFPLGTHMAAVVEAWGDRIEFLWIGPRGYGSPLEAMAAALPHYETIVRTRKG